MQHKQQTIQKNHQNLSFQLSLRSLALTISIAASSIAVEAQDTALQGTTSPTLANQLIEAKTAYAADNCTKAVPLFLSYLKEVFHDPAKKVENAEILAAVSYCVSINPNCAAKAPLQQRAQIEAMRISGSTAP